MGPVDEDHVMPFPSGTRIYCSGKGDGSLVLELSNAVAALSDIEFSTGCACLALTCFDISECTDVTVVNGSRSITMTRESLTLSDKHNEYPNRDCSSFSNLKQ